MRIPKDSIKVDINVEAYKTLGTMLVNLWMSFEPGNLTIDDAISLIAIKELAERMEKKYLEYRYLPKQSIVKFKLSPTEQLVLYKHIPTILVDADVYYQVSFTELRGIIDKSL